MNSRPASATGRFRISLSRIGYGCVRPGWTFIAVLAAAHCFAYVQPSSAQPATAVLSGPTNVVTAGERASLWLTFLNSSEVELTRNFPPKLKGRLGTEPKTHPVELELRNPAEAGDAVIPPGRFVRREYLLAVPGVSNGKTLFETFLPDLNPVTLNVRKPEVVANTDVKEGSFFLRFLKDGESEGFDPVQFFKDHVSGYDPLYFIAGTESPNAKFQVSFKYQLVSNDGALGKWAPPLKGFHFAYSQTSLWDWNGESAPFFDSSYRPEMLFAWERVAGGSSNWFRLDLQGGAQHESNGKGGDDSRSLNIAYLKPTLTLGRPGTLQLTLAPRAWLYVGGLEDNPDLEDYRGYVDLRAVVGWSKGVQLSALGRLGDDWNRGSLQLDLTYPMMKLLSRSFSVYLHAQYFIGYGESLLLYNERGTSFRVGFSFYR